VAAHSLESGKELKVPLHSKTSHVARLLESGKELKDQVLQVPHIGYYGSLESGKELNAKPPLAY